MKLVYTTCISVATTFLTFFAVYNYLPLSYLEVNTDIPTGATITTIAAGDALSASRAVINTNFSNLNTDKLETTNLDTCAEIAALGSLETGTCGSLVLSVSPTFTGNLILANASSTNQDVSGYFRVGTNSTRTAGELYGACTIWAPANTIDATSTQQAVCQGSTTGGISALAGVTTDSVCNVVMASSTNTTLGGLVIGGASASSTAGTIVTRLVNLTGTTFTWTATASSSAQWNYMCKDPL